MTDQEHVELLAQAVFAKRPVLGAVLAEHGEQSLAAYAAAYKEYPTTHPRELRQELITVVADEVGRLLGSVVAKSVEEQLWEHYYVSTADHHGPVTHPFFVHSNMVAAMPHTALSASHKHMIVLACSNVSLNNSSLPRSLLFHHDGADEVYGKMQLFPSNDRLSPVFRLRAFTATDIQRIRQGIFADQQRGIYSEALKEKLLSIIDDVYAKDAVLSRDNFAEQVTVTNFGLWKKVFQASGTTLSDLVYLEQEKIVSELLLRHHLFADTSVSRFLFDPKTLDQVEELFDGISGAFAKKDSKGTFLFWYFPKEGRRRIALWRQGDTLVSADGLYSIVLEPKEVAALLEDRQLIPSTMLCLAVLSSYYGLKCLGGFSQVNYATLTEAAWHTIFPSAAADASMQSQKTKSLCGDFTVGLIKTKSRVAPATALDFILYGRPESYTLFAESAKNITLRQAILPLFPELYAILYGEHEREEALSRLDFESVFHACGSGAKITPCLDIKNI